MTPSAGALAVGDASAGDAWRWLWPPLRTLMHAIDAERAHHAAVRALGALGQLPLGIRVLSALAGPPVADPVEVMGLRFRNRVGLAAGWDKDGRAWRGLAGLGFGHIEIGTVTPRPQPGKPRPRIFRLAEDEALINRMGFPGDGAAAVAQRLTGGGRPGARPQGVILGVNLGRNKDTPNEAAADDAIAVLDAVAPYADYVALNVSSPNTAGLRALQQGDALFALVAALAARRDALALPGGACAGRRLPLAVKIAPDLEPGDLDASVDAAIAGGAQAIIATNTTLARTALDGTALRSRAANETGGLSGRPLEARARSVLARVLARSAGRVEVIAAGGVASAEDARIRLAMGAALVQVYSGLVYRGPALVAEVARGASVGAAAARRALAQS